MRQSLQFLSRVNEFSCNVARNLAGVLLIAMVVIVVLQIIFRYALNDSLIWTEELSKTLMVWTAFLVAPWAYRQSANVRIELFVNELSAQAQRVLKLGINLLILWIVTVFLRESIGFWQRGLTVRTDSLPIQVAWFYSIVPVTFLLLFLVSIEMLIRDVLSLARPDENFTVKSAGDVFQVE